MPDEAWDKIMGSGLCVRDLVAMSMVNQQLRTVAMNHETADKTLVSINVERLPGWRTRTLAQLEARVREAWKHLPFVMNTAQMACVKTVATGHSIWTCGGIVQVKDWVVTGNSMNGVYHVWQQPGWTRIKAVQLAIPYGMFETPLLSMAECGGMLVTGSSVGPIDLWEAGSWTRTRTLRGHTDAVWDMLAYGHKYMLSCCNSGTVRAWDRTSWECVQCVRTGHTRGVICLAAHDGHVYCGGSDLDSTIRVIETTTWTIVGVMEGHTSTVNRMLLWRGMLLSCSRDRTIKMWSTEEDRACEQTIEGHTNDVQSIVVLGNKLVSGSSDMTMRVWGMRRGPGAWERERVLQDPTDSVKALMCIDGRTVVSGELGGNLRVWEEVP